MTKVKDNKHSSCYYFTMPLEQRLNTFKTLLLQAHSIDKDASFIDPYLRVIFLRRILETLFSALLIFGGQQFLIQNNFFSLIWPATGVALSAIFLRGNFLLLGCFIGVFLSYFYNHFSFALSFWQSLLFCAHIYIIRQVCLRFIGPIAPLAQIKVLYGFLIFVMFFSILHVLLFFRLMDYFHFPLKIKGMLAISCLAQINSILCLTPLCLVFDPFVSQRYFVRAASPWWTGTLLLTGCHFLYYYFPPTISISMGFLFIFVMASYAQHFGQIPTCVTLFSLSVLYLGGTLGFSHAFQFSFSLINILVISFLFTLTIIFSLLIATGKQEKKNQAHIATTH